MYSHHLWILLLSLSQYSGIDLSVKNICNAAFDCDQNSFRSLTMMPISMKNAVWKGSLVGFGTESLCPQKVVGRGKQSMWENMPLTRWTVWRPGRGSRNSTTKEEMRKRNSVLSVLLVLQSLYSDIVREGRKHPSPLLLSCAHPSGPI